MRGLVLCMILSVFMLASCTSARRISRIHASGTNVGLSVPVYEEEQQEQETDETGTDEPADTVAGGVIMNAVKDTETGEMVAVDIIKASKVTARFRHAAERNGKVSIEFDVTVPSEMLASKWQLRLYPVLDMLGDTVRLEPVLVTGEKYRAAQIRGYERYRAFISSLITDSADFVMIRPLEIFLKRYFPDTYAMKNDTSFVSEPMAENVFGVRQKDALEHYTRRSLMSRNERRREASRRMLERLTGGISGMIRLDTVIASDAGDVCYRYVQTLESWPGLRKIPVTLSGRIYENGEPVYYMPDAEEIVFYISSLSTLADRSPHYCTKVIERNVYDYTKAVIDFRQGSAEIDTLSKENVSEMSRIRDCLENVFGMSEFDADSVIVTASCSLEGSYGYNSSLSEDRAEAVLEYISRFVPDDRKGVFRTGYVPEDWDLFRRLVEHDGLISESTKETVLSLPYKSVPDAAEESMRPLPEYRYFREKLYPRLRTVRFDFYLHRKGMVKDTVHTSEIDSLYMKGVEALGNLDYKAAVEMLGKYRDYNSALAYLSAGYDEMALKILYGLKEYSARSFYLMSIAFSRLGRDEEAEAFFEKSVGLDPSMRHRGRLDPEIRKYNKDY